MRWGRVVKLAFDRCGQIEETVVRVTIIGDEFCHQRTEYRVKGRGKIRTAAGISPGDIDLPVSTSEALTL